MNAFALPGSSRMASRSALGSTPVVFDPLALKEAGAGGPVIVLPRDGAAPRAPDFGCGLDGRSSGPNALAPTRRGNSVVLAAANRVPHATRHFLHTRLAPPSFQPPNSLTVKCDS